MIRLVFWPFALEISCLLGRLEHNDTDDHIKLISVSNVIAHSLSGHTRIDKRSGNAIFIVP